MATTKTEFIDVIMRQGDGDTNRELSDNLRELVKRVSATGKAGTLTLTIKVSEVKKTGQLLIEDKIGVKLPEFDRPVGVAYADKEGNLLRENPDQRSFFDAVELEDTALTEIRTEDTVVVDLATGEIKENK